MRAILVPLDGSTLAESAVPTALAIARRNAGTRVEVVIVLDTPPDPLQVSGAPVTDRRLDHDLLAETRQYAESLRLRLTAMAGDVLSSLTILDGHPVERLAAYAREGAHDLIVMTTHGRTGVSRAWLGSVADGLLRSAPSPILLLREDSAATPDQQGLSFRDVVIALDEGTTSEHILPDALAITGTQARYHLIHVVVPERWLPPPSAFDVAAGGLAAPFDVGQPSPAKREAATQHLEAVAETLRARGVDVQVHIPDHPHPAESILALANQVGANLIAMTSHGRSGAARLFMGSVADKVVRGAIVPVLVKVPSPA